MKLPGFHGRAAPALHGVVIDPFSSHALVLNLPLEAGSPLAAAAAAYSAVGEPQRLTLRQLVRLPAPVSPGTLVYVCENPTVVNAAAEQFGPRSHPLVCTEGRPSTAASRVLAACAAAGCGIRYHGDFDWRGLEIGNDVIGRFNADPWRFSTADYLEALRTIGPTRPLQGPSAEAAWDTNLAAAMAAHGAGDRGGGDSRTLVERPRSKVRLELPPRIAGEQPHGAAPREGSGRRVAWSGRTTWEERWKLATARWWWRGTSPAATGRATRRSTRCAASRSTSGKAS